MDWQENIRKWRALPAEEKLRRRWDAIPYDVYQSMAFENEPVSLEHLIAMHRRIPPPPSYPREAAKRQDDLAEGAENR